MGGWGLGVGRKEGLSFFFNFLFFCSKKKEARKKEKRKKKSFCLTGINKVVGETGESVVCFMSLESSESSESSLLFCRYCC